jgi:ABC-type lipoprotein release transport system permease subunit
MRAMGVESGGVTSLFVFESVMLAAIFSIAGAIVATLVASLFRYIIVLPSGGNLGLFMNSGHLVLIPRFADMAATVAAISLLAALFSYFPARKGGNIPPVEALTKIF